MKLEKTISLAGRPRVSKVPRKNTETTIGNETQISSDNEGLEDDCSCEGIKCNPNDNCNTQCTRMRKYLSACTKSLKNLKLKDSSKDVNDEENLRHVDQNYVSSSFEEKNLKSPFKNKITQLQAQETSQGGDEEMKVDTPASSPVCPLYCDEEFTSHMVDEPMLESQSSIDFCSLFNKDNLNNLRQYEADIQICYMEAYGSGLLKSYLKREESIGNPLKFHKIEEHHRVRIAKWLDSVCEALLINQRSPRVYMLAMKIFDTFLAATAGKGVYDKHDVHALGITCLFMASKYEEIVPLTLHRVFSVIGNQQVPKNTIRKLELKILFTLKTVSLVTPLDFLSLITENLFIDCDAEQKIKKSFQKHLHIFLRGCIQHPKMVHFKPSSLALIALSKTMDLFEKKWDKVLIDGKENLNPNSKIQTENIVKRLNLKRRKTAKGPSSKYSRPGESKRILRETLRNSRENLSVSHFREISQNLNGEDVKKLTAKWRNQVDSLASYGMTSIDWTCAM